MSKIEDTGTSPALLLKVYEGFYVRISDISAITTGFPDEAGALVHPEVVIAHLSNGMSAPFPPCDNAEEAIELADALAVRIEAIGFQMITRAGF